MRPHWVEIPQTLADIPFLGAERFGERPTQRFKRDGVWQYLTYAELRDLAREVGLGLVALGVRPGDRVCPLRDAAGVGAGGARHCGRRCRGCTDLPVQLARGV